MTTRLYTNCILTAIAVLLGLLTLHAYRISITSNAYAQDEDLAEPTPLSTRRFSGPSSAAPLDLSNVAQTQDTAVANATSDVAAANREIAAALRDVANAIKDAGETISSAQPSAASSGATTSVGPSSGSAATGRSGENMIEVGPARAR